jgi:hypothetical protein
LDSVVPRLTNGVRLGDAIMPWLFEVLPDIVIPHECSYKAASKRRNAVALCQVQSLIGNCRDGAHLAAHPFHPRRHSNDVPSRQTADGF